MTEIDASTGLFAQAAVLLLVGMTFVFAFLSLLIIAIKVVITPLGNRFPDPIPKIKQAVQADLVKDNSSAVVAAISVAINKYRKEHQ
jgi:oxaloacetate decarboxylase gamma subunit